mmetsp:Transcript_24666/g.57435  ORF Transcript_24666/g.57435 Transcript_24666/m.57435 type:complete len:221 (-) Transcript_24666:861-1523(-)
MPSRTGGTQCSARRIGGKNGSPRSSRAKLPRPRTTSSAVAAASYNRPTCSRRQRSKMFRTVSSLLQALLSCSRSRVLACLLHKSSQAAAAGVQCRRVSTWMLRRCCSAPSRRSRTRLTCSAICHLLRRVPLPKMTRSLPIHLRRLSRSRRPRSRFRRRHLCLFGLRRCNPCVPLSTPRPSLPPSLLHLPPPPLQAIWLPPPLHLPQPIASPSHRQQALPT